MEDILIVDKPAGVTSFDVIRILRKKIGIRKMGHAGTLDPMATGLMVIGVGKGTKKLAGLIKLDKEYEAEILLGIRTTTGDREGETIEEKSVPTLSEEMIQKVLDGMVGTLMLQAPVYSAIKRGGVPLYAYARKGIEVEPPVREMKVYEAELLSLSPLRVRFTVSSGTYIRSLAEEFGKRMETVATLSALRRTKVGEFRIEDAIKITS